MLRQGKTNEELIQFLSHLSRTQTAAVWTYREIAAAEMRLRHWEAAVGHLLKAVKLRERDAMSWENLGVCFFNMGRLDSAKKATSRALAIDPTGTYGNALMAWLGGPGSMADLAQPQRRAKAAPSGPPHDLEILSEAYRHFKDAMRHLLRAAVRTSLESLDACGQLAARCRGNTITANKLLGDVAFLQLKLQGGQTDGQLGRLAVRRYTKAIHLAPNQPCLYRNLCIENPRLVAPDVVARCLEASLRLSMEGVYAGETGNLASSWSAVGMRQGSRYALIRALMLDRKNFEAWQALEGLANTSQDERAYCQTHVKQLHREEKDIFALILASKMDPESLSSDLFSRMQVADVIGRELMSVYLSDASNPMRLAVAELVNLLSFDSVVDVKVSVVCGARDAVDDATDGDDDIVEEGDRKRRHEMPWKLKREEPEPNRPCISIRKEGEK